mgnify:CR=1 FL=1
MVSKVRKNNAAVGVAGAQDFPDDLAADGVPDRPSEDLLAQAQQQVKVLEQDALKNFPGADADE